MPDAGDDGRDALWKLDAEVAEVTQDGRQTDGEEESEGEKHRDDKENNRHEARRTIAANVGGHDSIDRGHEDDSEKSADVEDEDLLGEHPGKREEEEDPEGKEDVAANVGAGVYNENIHAGLNGLRLGRLELDRSRAGSVQA